jgi:hypothetical protein
LTEILRDAGLLDVDEEEAPEKAALPTDAETKAGPVTDGPPTSERLRAIDVELLEIESMEV